MPPYNIPIPNEKAATYKVVTFIISLVNLVAFVYVVVRSGGNIGVFTTIGLISAIAAAGLIILRRYRPGSPAITPPLFLLLSSVCWLLLGIHLVAFALFIFSVLTMLTIQPLAISFTSEGIIYPSLPKKLISWQEVDFVMLKDDILSIELKNNKLMQFTLEKDASSTIDANEFNAYCALQAAS